MTKVPSWLEEPLGKYYLYFANHKGAHIKLAYADYITGPWKIYYQGALQLKDTPFIQECPELFHGIDVDEFSKPRGLSIPSPLDDMTIPHIASPDALADEVKKEIRLYYHRLNEFGKEASRVAISYRWHSV